MELTVALGCTALIGIGLAPFLERSEPPDTWFRVQWPRTLDEDDVVSLFRQLAALRRPRVLAIELQSEHGQIGCRLGVIKADSERLRHSVATFLPNVLLEPVERSILRLHHAVQLRLGTRERSLRTDAAPEIARSVAGALASAPGTTVVQWLFGPRLAPRHVAADSTGLPTTGQMLKQALLTGQPPLDARKRTDLQRKTGDQGFRLVLRIATTIPAQRAASGALGSVVGGLRVAEAPGVHLRSRFVDAGSVTSATPPRRWSMAINVAEVVGLLGWPLGDANYTGFTRLGSRRLPVPSAVARRGRALGDGNHPSSLRPIAQQPLDALTHTHVLGPTGVGKSTLLARLAIQDIAAGRGVALIESKGDLVNEILDRIPPHRERDVVVLDPTDQVAPVGLNSLAGGSPDLIADQVLAVFRGLYGDYLGPRTTDVLHASILTLARSGKATLVALPLLLSDEHIRKRLTGSVRDDLALGPFWSWFDALSHAERNQVIAPVMNKVRPFLLRERVRQVLGQIAPRFDITSVFTERKILLVPLSKGTLGTETASLIGSLVISRLWQAAQGRSRIAPGRRRPVSVIIDEFQDFLHLPTDLADVLAQARGLGVGLTLAHQHLAQLNPSMRAAVLANARNRVCFRLSADDASTIAKSTELLDARDFQSLGAYEIYASLVADGETRAFCSAVTRPLPASFEDGDRIRKLSRESFGTPTAAIEAELGGLWQAPTKAGSTSALGSRRRDVPKDGGTS